MGTRWRGLLAPVDRPAGDHRRVGEFTHRSLPLPHRWQREEGDGHTSSVVVGLTDAMAVLAVSDAVDQGWISAETARRLPPDMVGVFAHGEFFDDVDPQKMARLAQDATEARFLAEKGVLGPSVGPGEAELYGVVHAGSRDKVTDEEMAAAQEQGRKLDVETLFDHYEIAESTLVPVPAFGETSAPFEILPDGEPAALVAAVSGAVDLPVAARDMPWDGDAAKRRVFDHYTDGDGTVDVDAAGRAFLWRDPDADGSTMSAYKLGYADVVDGELRIVPRGVAATAGGRGVDAADIPAGDKARVKTRICALYGRVRAEHEDWPECPFDDARMAILAAATAVDVVYPADVFGRQPGDRVVPLTVEARRDGEPFRRVHGYVARWGTCHTGVRDVCTTAPESRTGYALYHRYPVDTDQGLVAAGRLTTGHARVGTGCTHLTCRGKDDHACDQMTIAETIGHYDQMKTVAYVRATETPGGIWLSGVTVDPELTAADRRVLARRKVSGDWRPHAGGFEMVEVLALAREDPGFPVHLHRGRQTALLAAGAVEPGPDLAARAAGMTDQQAALSAAGQPHTGAMVALVPTAEDARRLAVPGGLPPDELHVTLLYLGEAEDIPPQARRRVVDLLRDWVEAELRPDYGGSPVEADGFAVSLFNPGGPDPCVTLGLTGPDLELVHELAESTLAALDGEVDLPEQHVPWTPHMTLVYTDDADLVGGYADRAGPVELDRLRVAFGGEVVDIPITSGDSPEDVGESEGEPVVDDEMASRVAQLAADIEAGARADQAADLLAEVDATFHLPGRHDQRNHTPRRYRRPDGSLPPPKPKPKPKPRKATAKKATAKEAAPQLPTVTTRGRGLRWNEATRADQGRARQLADRARDLFGGRAVVNGSEQDATASQIIQHLDAWQDAIDEAERRAAR